MELYESGLTLKTGFYTVRMSFTVRLVPEKFGTNPKPETSIGNRIVYFQNSVKFCSID